MIKFKQSGNFKNTEKFFKKVGSGDYKTGIEYFAQAGVGELQKATPKATGKTSKSWSYSIEDTNKGVVISWNNSNIINGVNVAAIIQQGHVMPSGYYVEPVDYINPALEPVIKLLGDHVFEEVKGDAKQRR